MKLRSIAYSFVLVTVLYGISLFFLDITSNSLTEIKYALQFLPFLMVLSVASFFLRYLRWYWLLSTAGQTVPFFLGFSCYLSGFALTASPGKIGELLRIRYFQHFNVPPEIVVSAFIFERACDLLVVLMLGLFAAAAFDFFPLLAGSIILIVLFVLLAARKPYYLRVCAYLLRKLGLKTMARLFRVLIKGITGVNFWITPWNILLSFVLGGLAWLTLSLSFTWFLNTSGMNISFLSSLSIYPIAMLVGALSMLPGGLGSTEAAIVMQLGHYGAPLMLAGVAAICIRIATLWFAIVCGILTVLFLEFKIMPDKKLAE